MFSSATGSGALSLSVKSWIGIQLAADLEELEEYVEWLEELEPDERPTKLEIQLDPTDEQMEAVLEHQFLYDGVNDDDDNDDDGTATTFHSPLDDVEVAVGSSSSSSSSSTSSTGGTVDAEQQQQQQQQGNPRDDVLPFLLYSPWAFSSNWGRVLEGQQRQQDGNDATNDGVPAAWSAATAPPRTAALFRLVARLAELLQSRLTEIRIVDEPWTVAGHYGGSRATLLLPRVLELLAASCTPTWKRTEFSASSPHSLPHLQRLSFHKVALTHPIVHAVAQLWQQAPRLQGLSLEQVHMTKDVLVTVPHMFCVSKNNQESAPQQQQQPQPQLCSLNWDAQNQTDEQQGLFLEALAAATGHDTFLKELKVAHLTVSNTSLAKLTNVLDANHVALQDLRLTYPQEPLDGDIFQPTRRSSDFSVLDKLLATVANLPKLTTLHMMGTCLLATPRHMAYFLQQLYRRQTMSSSSSSTTKQRALPNSAQEVCLTQLRCYNTSNRMLLVPIETSWTQYVELLPSIRSWEVSLRVEDPQWPVLLGAIRRTTHVEEFSIASTPSMHHQTHLMTLSVILLRNRRIAKARRARERYVNAPPLWAPILYALVRDAAVGNNSKDHKRTTRDKKKKKPLELYNTSNEAGEKMDRDGKATAQFLFLCSIRGQLTNHLPHPPHDWSLVL